VTDALGSTVALSDSSGTVRTSYTYGPFGESSVTGASSANTAEFSGRENDGVGVAFYRYRYYISRQQRFISEDPLRLAGGSNVYSYAANRPTMLADSLGLKPGPRFGGPPNGGGPGAGAPGRSGPGTPGAGGNPGNGRPSSRGTKPPEPQRPDRSRCMHDCLGRELSQDWQDYKWRIKSLTAVGSPVVGVGLCGVVVACEPYLLPAFPSCAGYVTASNVALTGVLSSEVLAIQAVAGGAGCAMGCGGY
jgi:RHS repeat-associated protein